MFSCPRVGCSPIFVSLAVFRPLHSGVEDLSLANTYSSFNRLVGVFLGQDLLECVIVLCVAQSLAPDFRVVSYTVEAGHVTWRCHAKKDYKPPQA